jgi:hypothetical protein
MNLSALDWVLWMAGFLGEVALFSILIFRRRSREFPAFTTLIGFIALRSLALYLIHAYGSRLWYARVYYSTYFPGFALRIGMVWEVARIVMRPTGSWLRDAKKQFILGGAAGILLAAALSWMLSFTDLVVCELFVLMLLAAKQFGLGFQNHVFALVTGWSGWVAAAMLVDLLHGYLGNRIYFGALDNVRKCAYLAALVYWIIQFWKEEPARQDIPPELRAYILALHERVNKNIDRLSAQR